ncbi:unnamed protein product [Cuscuta epithymum]|uniref:Protein kinase domain-containing protein n=1 Tax=Cuscuta epithymum TaxID=186058 RepID=A0AAV0D8U4_9ASTE|nr:unnamed protein product [Cuscuta epithymum]
MRCRAADADQTARQFSLEEIQLTTNSFSHEFLIGAGGYGKVYRGCIDEGATVVAIKRLKEGSRQGDKEFQTEIKMLSEARNEHLVSLIGFCNEGNERVLIYEYMPRGTLEDHLHHISTGNMPLSWEMRLKISIGAAQGLHYLHTFNHHNAIIHRDVKSSNILLDGDWVAKISDFGLSKMGHRDEPFAHVSTDVKGTFGYFDPEYFLTRRLTTKSDVYSFGVVLLEVLTGRAALDKRLVMEQKSLATWSAGYMRKGNVHEIVETSLAGQVSRACLEEFVDIVQRCLRTQPHRRPDMAHVVSRLELALALQQNEAAEKMVMSTDSDGAFSSDDLSGPFLEELSIGKGKDMIHMEKKRISSTKRSAPARWRGFLKRFTVTKPSSSAQPSKIKAAPSTLPSKIKVAPSTLPSKIKADPSSTTQFEGLFHFSHKDIKHATENFSESSVIGFVDTDKVYIGYLNGGWIAIRRAISEPSSIQMACKLQLKLHNLQLPSHPNVVSLIGYCDLPDKRSLMLVYNYMEKGSSLYDHLHDNPKDPLPWKQMLKICIDAGHGLNYLQPILKQSMLHCNFNSTNILLDENWAAKVSEICWSRRTDCIDPSEGAYQQSVYVHEPALEKSYVFAFGGLLIEILSANCEMHWKIQERVSFAEWFGSYSRCTDKNIYGIMSPECHSMFMDMAKSCLQKESRKRPTMGEIIAGLEAALCLQEKMEDEAAMSIDSDGAISLDDLCEPSQES